MKYVVTTKTFFEGYFREKDDRVELTAEKAAPYLEAGLIEPDPEEAVAEAPAEPEAEPKKASKSKE